MYSVLLVDDDENFRRSLAIGLEASGYRVFEARSGMEALEFLQHNQKSEDRVERIIVDARMPGLDGFWLTDQILSMYSSLNVIILTAHPYPEKIKQYTLLIKPIRITTLVDVLEEKVRLAEKNKLTETTSE